MIDVMQDEEKDMLSMETENRTKRRMYRNLAIQALDGFMQGTVSQEDYDYAVAEYSDILKEIHATEQAHLAHTGE